MNNDHHSMKSLVYEYSQIDFHVQQRKKVSSLLLPVHSCNSFPPLFSYLSESIRTIKLL